MSERKFTDAEIVKALECCSKDVPILNSCEGCPFAGKKCAAFLPQTALALINRQRAEIERLQKTGASAMRKLVNTKAEANKEIDKLKDVISLLERDIADRDKMLEGKVEEVYADFMRDYKEIRDELEDLLDSGVLLPPVKIGQTVYAGLAYDDEEEVIEEYTAGGVGYIDGEWLVYCKKDRDWYQYGTELCKPTREEAEAAIAAARSATDIKDGHKSGGAE